MPAHALVVSLSLLVPVLQDDLPQKPEELRLFDYKPKSQMRVLEHPIERAKFPAINVHTHPGGIKSAEQVQRVVKDMDDANIAVTVSLDGMWGETLAKHQELLAKDHAGRFIVFAQIDYRGDGDANDMSTWAVNRADFGTSMAAKLDDACRRGARDLKIHKSHGLYLSRSRPGRTARSSARQSARLTNRATNTRRRSFSFSSRATCNRTIRKHARL